MLDDMTVDITSNKQLNLEVTELFFRGRKLNASNFFITQTCFPEPKDVRLNSTMFLSCKFYTNDRFSKMQLIIYHILTLNKY